MVKLLFDYHIMFSTHKVFNEKSECNLQLKHEPTGKPRYRHFRLTFPIVTYRRLVEFNATVR